MASYKYKKTGIKMKFRAFLENNINEKLITFGGKAYPKFGQVVILSDVASRGQVGKSDYPWKK